MLKVTVEEQAIRFGERCAISVHRTLRIPDDGRTYPLPPGLGRFPLFRVEDYLQRVPAAWRQPGAVFIPMYQREALWFGFHGAWWKPNALMVSIGRVNCISGATDSESLSAAPQNYLVCPDQPWLDGINSGRGSIRQFVAMPLGQGYSVEASLTGAETFGGIQLRVFESKPGRFPDRPAAKPGVGAGRMAGARSFTSPTAGMGLAAGGVMKQKIYPDPYGLDSWDLNNFGLANIHILNSACFHALTGLEPPPTPVEATTYSAAGLPWFDRYDEDRGDLEAPQTLQGAVSITERDAQRGEPAQPAGGLVIPETQVRKVPGEHPERQRRPATDAPEGSFDKD